MRDDSFKVVVRGYDRSEVDGRLKDLLAELSMAKQVGKQAARSVENLRAEVLSLKQKLKNNKLLISS